MGNRRQRAAAPEPERARHTPAPVQRQADPAPTSTVMNLQHTAGNRAVQRMVQREWDDDEPDRDNLPSRGRSNAINASNSLREGEVTPHAERAAYVSGANLTGTNLTDAIIGTDPSDTATFTWLDGVTWNGTICPSRIVSDANRGSCSGQLNPRPTNAR